MALILKRSIPKSKSPEAFAQDIPAMPAHLPSFLPSSAGWQPVSHGESGDAVFRSGDASRYAKVAGPARRKVLTQERRRVEWLSKTNIGAPRVLDWIESDDGAALILSAVPGIPASALPAADLLKAWPSMAETLTALHSLPVASCPFSRRLADMVAIARDVVGRNAVNPEFLSPQDKGRPPAELLAEIETQVPQRLEQEKADLVICHGDACMPNFMVDPETLRCTGLIDLGRLGLADRHADFALMLANARESWETGAQAESARQILFGINGLTEDDGRLGFYLRLDPLTWG